MNVNATLNGHHVLDLRIELRRGGAPSSFSATLPPGTNIATGPADVAVGDGETRRTFRQFHVERVQSSGDGRITVKGRDLRRSWDRRATPPDGAASAQGFIDALFASAGLAGQAPRVPGAAHPANIRGTNLGQLFENYLCALGLTCTVNDAGELLVLPLDAAPAIDPSRIIETLESASSTPAAIHVAGAPAIELRQLTTWQPVIPAKGTLRPLTDVLTEWGIEERVARQACLSDGGFEQLVPHSGADAANRLAMLKRYAFRLFRVEGEHAPWVPVGGIDSDGVLLPPLLSAQIARGKGIGPKHPRDDLVEELSAIPIEEFELDPNAGTVYLPRPPYRVSAENHDDPTLQARHLIGPPLLTLTVGAVANREPFSLAIPGDGEPLLLHADHLVSVYDTAGTLLNLSKLSAQAHDLAARFLRTQIVRESRIAGVVDALAGGTCERVVIEAGREGLVCTLIESPPATPEFAGSDVPGRGGGHLAGPVPSGLYQPVNAYRAGPLILRASGETPESESVLAMEATHRRAGTGALDLVHPGSLAFPFFVANEDASRFGRWFFVAGVEAAEGGRFRILAPDDRHAEISSTQLFEGRHVAPRGLRGLIVSLGDERRFVDAGPLISDARGRDPGGASNLVYDLDGSRISARKRGGFQFLSVLVLSPAHRDEGVRDGGWVPALNLREGDTANPEVLGRGLFAESQGRDLGRLTAIQQGGPILGDGSACAKHLYGMTGDDDGLYRETAGHISTDAFFKIPGDPVHDAPLKFYPEDFDGGVPPWPPYEAQLKYDPAEKHAWNHTRRDGRWKIQYRVPFLPEIPPTWDPPVGPPADPPADDPPAIHVPVPSYLPYDVRPAVSEYELWAPSHDWVPAPSSRPGGNVKFPGPSIKSEAWAGEINGVPDPSLGGGCIYLPPDMSMPDAQIDRDRRQTFLALHPEVVLAFGHPHFGNGRVHSGWAILLANGDLELLARDSNAVTPPGLARGVHITGHLNVGPNGATFDDTQALRLGANDDEGIAFGEDVQLYREAETTLRTDANFEIGGKLTVEGLIDPTGLELDPQSGNPGSTPENTLWVNSGDSRLRIGANALAYVSEIVGDKRVEIITYTGSGEEGNAVLLTGINRAHVLLIFRDDDAIEGCVLALPLGAPGTVRDRNLSDGSSGAVLDLDGPSSGAQTLIINSIDGSRNANGVPYRLLAIGTP